MYRRNAGPISGNEVYWSGWLTGLNYQHANTNLSLRIGRERTRSAPSCLSFIFFGALGYCLPRIRPFGSLSFLKVVASGIDPIYIKHLCIFIYSNKRECSPHAQPYRNFRPQLRHWQAYCYTFRAPTLRIKEAEVTPWLFFFKNNLGFDWKYEGLSFIFHVR